MSRKVLSITTSTARSDILHPKLEIKIYGIGLSKQTKSESSSNGTDDVDLVELVNEFHSRECEIENYYVAEDTGNPVGKLTAQVVVPASGHPKIKEVFVDGKPYALAMKNETR
jgi:hypothetical protein